MIIHRIWIIDRTTFPEDKRGSRYRSPLRRAIRIIIESGMLYTVTVLIGYVLFLVGSTVYYISSHLVSRPFTYLHLRKDSWVYS